MSFYECKFLVHLNQHVEKENTDEPLHEILRLFKQTPNSKNWDKLFNRLKERFSDTTLHDAQVAKTWAEWNNKLIYLEDEFDWSLSFKDKQIEKDLWNFIQINSQIKNFNY